MRFRAALIGALLVVVATAGSVFGQGFQGGIRGSIKDAGGVIPGVEVTLTNEQTNIKRSSITNERGEFVFANVDPGNEGVNATLQGYKTADRGGIRIGTDSGDLHRGWVWRDGEYSSIRDWDVKTELADDGITHRVSHVRASDKLGRVHELRADVVRVAPHRMDHGNGGSILNEGLARWTYEGRTGWGISEYLHTLDADGRPTIPIE